jgi:hypothetical protein|tara:strand:- start:200 stop:382 length:183 start_codon:yes stop_codon:yes gene_type:complete
MGCGCKKRKKAVGQKAIDNGEIGDGTPVSISEQKDYRGKVSEALKQFADLKIKKRHLRGK